MKNTFALFVAKLAKWSFLLKRVSSPGCSAAHHIEFNTQNNDAIQPFASLLFSEDDQQSATTTQPATNKQDIKDSKGSQPETKENELRSRPQPVATSPEWKRVNDDMACCTAIIKDAIQPFASLSFFVLSKNFIMKIFARRSVVIVIAFVIANLFLVQQSIAQSQTFSTPGTFSGVNGFTAPAGVTSVTVEVWGGGGKGGSTTLLGHTGGGGGGAYSKKNTIAVTPGNSYTVVVGTGATTTSAGGDSYFIDISTVFAKGGNSVANNSANGVAGGSAASGAGDTKLSGGGGANGVTGQGGGGGSSAGTNVDGANGSGGTGGTAPAGGGKGGNGASTGNTPQAGSSPGGGGGGTSSLGSSSGGNGGNGKVIISWTACPTITASASKLDLKCFQVNEGAITITGSGGTSPYMFSIDNVTNYNATVIAGATYQAIDATNGKFINLPIGTYKIRVKDANGCESKQVQ